MVESLIQRVELVKEHVGWRAIGLEGKTPDRMPASYQITQVAYLALDSDSSSLVRLLGGRGDGASACVPDTHLGDLDVYLILCLIFGLVLAITDIWETNQRIRALSLSLSLSLFPFLCLSNK